MPEADSNRNAVIVRTSVISIAVNVLLSIFKAAIGILTSSIAITLDAVNNLSDAASGIITIIGTRLAAKSPDKKHPFGYGRIEYLSAMIISAIVLYAGVTSLVESVKKIITPETPDYSAVALIIVAVAVVVKILLGSFVKATGKKVHSDSLMNSGEDSRLDSIISASTLVAAAIYLIWGLSLEAILGIIISVIIIKSGIEMLRDTISEILGQSADPQVARAIKETVCAFPGVCGAYDLIVYDYGPSIHLASIHIEVPDTYSAEQIDELTRKIFDKVYAEHGIALTGVSVYARASSNSRNAKAWDEITKAVMDIENVKQMHGFYMDEENKTIRFDVVISLDAKDRMAVYQRALSAAQSLYPDYSFNVVIDTDYAEV